MSQEAGPDRVSPISPGLRIFVIVSLVVYSIMAVGLAWFLLHLAKLDDTGITIGFFGAILIVPVVVPALTWFEKRGRLARRD